MKSAIGVYFRSLDRAILQAKQLNKMWEYRVRFFVIQGKNGCLVVGEDQVRIIYPQLKLPPNKGKKQPYIIRPN